MQLGLDLPAHWPDTGHPIENLFPELLEIARFGVEIDFDSFVLAEHHFNDYFVQPAPLALASYLAAVTERQRIIVSVMVLPLHDIRRLAGEITMTDHLTNGRLEIGVGRGGAQFEFDCFGLPYDKSREIFEDRLKALFVLFSGEDVSYEGPHTSIPTLTIMPPPLQKPHPPMWMAVIRPEAAYHCARNGYNVQTSVLRRDPSVTKEVIEAFRRGQSEAVPQSRPQQISVHQTIYVTEGDAEISEKLEMVYANHQRFMNHFTTAGTIVGGITQPIEITETIEDLSKAVIVGPPEYCVERLLQLKELGFDKIILRWHFGASHEDIMVSLNRFAEHVMPHIVPSAVDASRLVRERA